MISQVKTCVERTRFFQLLCGFSGALQCGWVEAIGFHRLLSLTVFSTASAVIASAAARRQLKRRKVDICRLVSLVQTEQPRHSDDVATSLVKLDVKRCKISSKSMSITASFTCVYQQKYGSRNDKQWFSKEYTHRLFIFLHLVMGKML